MPHQKIADSKINNGNEINSTNIENNKLNEIENNTEISPKSDKKPPSFLNAIKNGIKKIMIL